MSLKKKIKANADILLSFAAIGGLITTVFFAIKKTPEAYDILEDTIDRMDTIISDAEENDRDEVYVNKALNTEKLYFVKDICLCYMPMIVSGITTIILIRGSNKVSRRQNAFLTSALNASNIVYQEYRDHMKTVLGDRKEAQEYAKVECKHVNEAPFPDKVIETGNGNMLCATEIVPGDSDTMIFWRSTPQNVMQAEIKLNNLLLSSQSDHIVTQADMLYFLGVRGLKGNGVRLRSHKLHDGDLIKFQYDSFIREDLNEPVLFIDTFGVWDADIF